MRRYLRPSAVNDPVSAWGYTRAMMNKRILTICAAVSAALAAGAAGTSLASAQGYPIPPGAVYSPNPPPYPRGGSPTDYRGPRPMDFDVLEDEDGPMLELLKTFHHEPIVLPSRQAWRPDREQLAVRFERFAAG